MKIPFPLRMLMLAFVLMPAIADAQTTADFFDSQVLQEVQVFINSRDLKELRENYWENRYYPADFVWRGVFLGIAAQFASGDLLADNIELHGQGSDLVSQAEGFAPIHFIGKRGRATINNT